MELDGRGQLQEGRSNLLTVFEAIYSAGNISHAANHPT
jgi:hypothetical protein